MIDDATELLGRDVLQLGAGARVGRAEAVDDDDLTRHATFRPPAYIPSISAWYRFSRMRRLTLSVGVIEPSSIVRSRGQQREGADLLVVRLVRVVRVDLAAGRGARIAGFASSVDPSGRA